MKRILACVLLLGCDSSPPALAGEDNGTGAMHNWPRWRGPLDTGAAPHAKPPIEWSEKQDARKNIRWKIPLPGKGHSTPIAWNDQLFITTAIPFGNALEPRYSNAPGAHDNLPTTHRHRFVVLAVRRRDGEILWQKTMSEKLPHEGGHYTASLASNSPVTDGEHLVAFFGSHGLFCLDLAGKLLWKKQLGEMQSKHGHGEGASPALFGGTLIVNWDHEGQSFVIALDVRSGAERWKIARDEVTSWASPIVIEHTGKPQVIISGTGRVRGYDLVTGDVIWECGGLSGNVVASPVAGDGMVFAGSSYEIRSLLAIRLDGARGDVTGTRQIAWARRRGTPYVPSPLLVGNALYFLAHYQGVLTRVDAKTGEDFPGAMRLGPIRDVYASPVAADKRVYITDRNGTTVVISDDATPKLLAINHLQDNFSASAAVVDGEIYLRGEKYLYCIAEE